MPSGAQVGLKTARQLCYELECATAVDADKLYRACQIIATSFEALPTTQGNEKA